MASVKVIRRGIFPLRKLTVEINNCRYYLRGNDKVEINFDSKEYQMDMQMDLWKSNKIIRIEDNSKTILITYCLPDLYFWIGLIIIGFLAFFTFFSKINPLVLSAAVLLFFIPQLYYFLVKKGKYFNCKIE